MLGNTLVALLAEGVDRNRVELLKVRKVGGSPSSRRAWIEIAYVKDYDAKSKTSPSSRRAWIEILRWSVWPGGGTVALLAEGVDRNQQGHDLDAALQVALLAEGVDRNSFIMFMYSV